MNYSHKQIVESQRELQDQSVKRLQTIAEVQLSKLISDWLELNGMLQSRILESKIYQDALAAKHKLDAFAMAALPECIRRVKALNGRITDGAEGVAAACFDYAEAMVAESAKRSAPSTMVVNVTKPIVDAAMAAINQVSGRDAANSALALLLKDSHLSDLYYGRKQA